MKMKQAKGRSELENTLVRMGDHFPSTRYFQVHFEYLESLLIETRDCLEGLKRQVAAVNEASDEFDATHRAAKRSPRPGLSLEAERRLRAQGRNLEDEQWEGF
ncbi:hypothetical protein [Methyloterricola oryzae]|uniref:hypothetical protein n=1 Tax=Methyloterricola oryzae TaxID=1495050 RepID=UPI0005EB7253|nr:hypothetical protein [Methyloterricola oryzae]